MSKPTADEIERLRLERDAALAEEEQARESLHTCLRGSGYFGIPSNDEERAIYAQVNAVYQTAHTKASTAVNRHYDAYQRFAYGDEDGNLPPEDPLAGDDQGMTGETGYEVYTTQQVAKRLGIDESRVRRLADKRNLGRKVGPRMRLFTAAEIAQMRERPAGKAGQAYYQRLRDAQQTHDE